MHPPDHSVHLPDPAATDAFGAALASALAPGLTLFLNGELGAGKTALVRAMLRALGHSGPVKSPTYALVELYNLSRLCLYHFDLYRFNEPDEFLEAGLDELFRENAVCCVEWPDKAAGVLPAADLDIRFRVEDAGPHDGLGAGGGRRIFLHVNSNAGAACLARLIARMPEAAPSLRLCPIADAGD